MQLCIGTAKRYGACCGTCTINIPHCIAGLLKGIQIIHVIIFPVYIENLIGITGCEQNLPDIIDFVLSKRVIKPLFIYIHLRHILFHELSVNHDICADARTEQSLLIFSVRAIIAFR